jgi:hypothetical protein
MFLPLIGQKYVQVMKTGTDIRFSPSSSSNIITQAKIGNIFELSAEKGDWYEIVMTSGEYRYIKKSDCHKVNYIIELPKSEQICRAVFKALLDAEDKATAEADKRYPVIIGSTEKDIHKNLDFQSILDDKYKLEVFNRFNLQPPLYGKLTLEGAQKKWKF